MQTQEQAITNYVYANYKSYTDKELFITIKGNIIFVNKHINGSPLILSTKILEV